MLASVGDAIDALAVEINGLLTVPSDPALTPQVAIHPTRARLAGIGGFIDLHDSPKAEIHGRHLQAEVIVRVMAADQAGLLAAETQATRDILAADPAFLRRRGLLRVQRITEPRPQILAAADGLPAPFGRDLRFDVRFEHKPVPAASEAPLATVAQDVTAGGDGTGQLLYQTEFLSDPLADFRVFNSGGAGTVGNWSYDAAGQELTQTGTRRAGSDGLSGNKGGTFLALRAATAGAALLDFVLNAEVRSDGPGGIGLVFRFTDHQNFGFALLESSPAARIMGKRQTNAGSFLQSGGQDDSQGYPQNEWLRLRLLAEGDRLELAINEAVALSGIDQTLTTPGEVGFFCRNNGTARFRHFRLSSL